MSGSPQAKAFAMTNRVIAMNEMKKQSMHNKQCHPSIIVSRQYFKAVSMKYAVNDIVRMTLFFGCLSLLKRKV